MQSLILCRNDELGKKNGRAGKYVGHGRSVAARRIEMDNGKMGEHKVCKPMNLCRRDEWEEGNDARGSVPGSEDCGRAKN